MGIEWIAVGAVLAAGALFGGFPVGLFVGYAWRDRISRKRRLLVAEERRRAEIDRALRAFALPEEATAADRGISDGDAANYQPTISRARKRTDADASAGKRTRRQRAQSASEVKLTVVARDTPQEPEQPGEAPKSTH